MTKTHLSKTGFLNYLICPRFFYEYLRQDISKLPIEENYLDQEMELQGKKVERAALELFKGIQVIEGLPRDRRLETDRLVSKQTRLISQATAMTDGNLLASADVLKLNKRNRTYDLFEIKSTNSIKPEYYWDVAFQKIAFDQTDIKIGKVHLVYLNKKFILDGELDVNKLFVVEDVSQAVDEKLEEVRREIETASKQLEEGSQAPECQCHLKAKSKRCPLFNYFHPEIPEYSIYDIARISAGAINRLNREGILKLEDIPDDFKLSELQRSQVQAYQTGQTAIDAESIESSFQAISFPIHFLDYESANFALPRFPKSSPYQHVPFQFSIHILKEIGRPGDLEHREYLAQDTSGKSLKELVQALQSIIGSGSVVSWGNFEEMIHDNLAKLLPEDAPFLRQLNSQIFDLNKIFTRQYYVDAGFKGSTSIKNVLPVLVPELDYSDLSIQKGRDACLQWQEALENPDRQNSIFEHLRQYCSRDTYAMAQIFLKLAGLIDYKP